jgi:transposase-like protein
MVGIFDREIIVLVEMMAERGVSLAHTTIMRWVKRFTPEFVKRWNRLGTQVGHGVLTRPI